ncbi:antiterminator Q family protein [Variovorax sp. 375MFSha3.1]|uniref:antiterminator Q family protein n=1 Tax=Variovorax sp. 375MFSha3.1 TaxID=3158364 RepID=UPI003AAE9A91
MARIEWVKARLENWAMWKARGEAGGLGWSSQSAFLNEPAGGYRQSRIPIDEVDASVTDQAVESLKETRPSLYQVLQCVHARGVGVKATARALECSESNVKALLDAADRVLGVWFTERAAKQAAAREALRGGFTT